VRVSDNLTKEDKELLEGMGVVFTEGEQPHFQKKEETLPPGTRRLSTGKIIRYTPIEECLKR
jgi:hypothetical protein